MPVLAGTSDSKNPDPYYSVISELGESQPPKLTKLKKLLCHCLQDAEQCGYTAEDIQVSLNHCGDVNPVSWLRENWDNMMDTVVTLASNVGHEAEENTIGTLSKIEAKEALRKHKGNIWAAVTECVEQRQMRVRFFVHLFQVQSWVIHKLLYANLPPPPTVEKMG